MGVMACNRNGCENIMCTTYFDDHGYICKECQEEFVEWTERELHIPTDTKDKVRIGLLGYFMAKRKRPPIKGHEKSERLAAWSKFFEEHTNDL